jgi:hypothetical protein
MQDQLLRFDAEVKYLTDSDLLSKLERIFVFEKKCTDAILLGLKEIKARRLYITAGYSSLFEMLVKFYKLSETIAYQKISTLRLIEAVPLAQEALLNNEVNSSTLAEVQSFINKTEKASESKMPSSEKENLVKEIKGKTLKETKELLGDKNPEFNLPPDREKPLTSNLTLLQIKVDTNTMSVINELKSLLSHQVPDGNLKEILKIMAEMSLEQIKKRKGINYKTPKNNKVEKTSKEENSETAFAQNCKSDVNSQPLIKIEETKSPVSAKPCVKRSRYISREVRRAVSKRAEGQCEHIHPDSGERCQSRHQLEFDHAQAFSQGGSNELDNIFLKCRNHNLFRTKETHGFWYQAK